MDNSINDMHNELIKKINEKKNTHPNLMMFWENILNQKKKSYLKCCNDISNNFKFLNNINDLTKEQIILITYLSTINSE